MSRKQIVTLHLALAAFFAPLLIITGLSGGLYLFGEKGEVVKEVIYQEPISDFDFATQDMQQQIRQFIQNNNIEHEFEYVKGSGNTYYTRPTSKQHLVFSAKDDLLIVTKQTPNFVKSIVELHKGHGPTAFKVLQKIMSFGLMLILISGLFLGLTSPLYKTKTLYISGIGGLVFILLATL